MMRLDKFVSKAALLSRTTASAAIRHGRVFVNGAKVTSPDSKVDENADVTLDSKKLVYSEFIYIMFNKPAGVLSATEDGKGTTVLDFLPEAYSNSGLFPVGRLDKDTVGLLIISNDGKLAHELLSPKHHVDKTYRLKCEKPLSDEDAAALEAGVDIGEKAITMPAKLICDEDRLGAKLTICEGKFHQIKRMLEAVSNKVTYLERISFGGIELDKELERGKWRLLSEEEINILKRK